MKKQNKKTLIVALSLLISFALWTAATALIDVRPQGPEGSSVGFATLNRAVHEATGVNMTLYTITDILGLVPIFLAAGFAFFGLFQLIRRKSLFKVELSLIVLGGFYILVTSAYLLFEVFVLNYRPILINGVLEASYPSSTTMLAICILPTAAMQFGSRIKAVLPKRCVTIFLYALTVFMVVGRLLSGVHWFSDIVGGVLLGTGLVVLYVFFCRLEKR